MRTDSNAAAIAELENERETRAKTVERLAEKAASMRLSVEQDGLALADSSMGHFAMAIDPTLFMPMAKFGERLQAYLDAFKREPGIYAAGGPEWERRRQRGDR